MESCFCFLQVRRIAQWPRIASHFEWRTSKIWWLTLTRRISSAFAGRNLPNCTKFLENKQHNIRVQWSKSKSCIFLFTARRKCLQNWVLSLLYSNSWELRSSQAGLSCRVRAGCFGGQSCQIWRRKFSYNEPNEEFKKGENSVASVHQLISYIILNCTWFFYILHPLKNCYFKLVNNMATPLWSAPLSLSFLTPVQ